MTIQFNTDRSIIGGDKLKTYFSASILEQLSRYSEHITRVEVYLSGVNGEKERPYDKRCLLEARTEGRQPIAVAKLADTYEQAILGATEKLLNSLDRIFGRLKNH